MSLTKNGRASWISLGSYPCRVLFASRDVTIFVLNITATVLVYVVYVYVGLTRITAA